jgi:hypothetical protein
MEVNLIRSKSGEIVGWEMKADIPEELSKLRVIRNLQFFGFDDTAIVYNGRKDGDDKEGNPGTLSWKQRDAELEK